MSGDPRSEKVAVVADALFASSLPALRQEGYGVMQLPPPASTPASRPNGCSRRRSRSQNTRRNGYQLVLVDDGSWGDRLDEALALLGTPPLARR